MEIQINERETQVVKNQVWPLNPYDLYILSKDSKSKAIYLVQEKLQREKHIKNSCIKIGDFDKKLELEYEIEKKNLKMNVDRLHKKISKTCKRVKKNSKKEKVSEPYYLKTFKYYVDEIEKSSTSEKEKSSPNEKEIKQIL